MAINRKTVTGAIMAALLMVCVPAIPATAAGTGIALAPAYQSIDDALRGADYDLSLIVNNMSESATYYSIEAEGDAAGWLSYYYKGADTDMIQVEGLSRETFEVRVSVPEDAINGQHQATIAVTSIPDPAKSGAVMALRALSDLFITVTGTQVIAGTVSDISVSDVETGYPLKIQVFLKNTGNVEVSPIITANITSNGKAIDNLTKNDTKVGAGEGEFIIVEWDTTGSAPADYEAEVVVNLDGKDIASEVLPFKILPLGTLTRSGELKGIELNDAPLVNLVTKMTATFKNTGQIDTWAKFTGEIYRDDQRVDTFTGEELLIQKGTEGKLVAYFKVTETGEYTIKGWVVYEGKETESKELDVTVTEVQTSSGNVAGMEGNPPDEVNPGGGITIVNADKGLAAVWYIVIGIAGAALIAAVYLFVLRKKRLVPLFNHVNGLANKKFFNKIIFNGKK
jgi:hypothetical protein